MNRPTTSARMRRSRSRRQRYCVGVAGVALLGSVVAGCGGASSPNTVVTSTLRPTVSDGVQVFTVVGTRSLEFSASELVAAPGRIRVEFSVEAGSAPHNFVVPEITAAKTEILSAGASQTIEFIADERGSFQVVCTLHPNMLATLKIV